MWIAILVSVGLVLGAANAESKKDEEYGHYDVNKSMIVTRASDGSAKYSFDLAYVDHIIADLSAHARNYPPDFASEEEKTRAVYDAGWLAVMIDMTVESEDTKPQYLLRAGVFYSVCHNLDIEGATQKAIGAFERLLEKEPEHAQGHYHYGVFLAGTATMTKRSLPHLEKALKLGVGSADYSLGLAHLLLGNNAEALRYLQAFLARHPDNAATKTMVEAIAAGRVEPM